MKDVPKALKGIVRPKLNPKSCTWVVPCGQDFVMAGIKGANENKHELLMVESL